MIIECDKCKSKFELDEGILKPDGSKVRCSVCQDVFTAFPSELPPAEASSTDDLPDEDLQETVALDFPPDLEREPSPVQEDQEADLEAALDDALGEEGLEAISLDEIPDEPDEAVDLEGAMDQASEIEEELTKEDGEEKAAMKTEDEDGTPPKRVKRKKKAGIRIFPIILVIVLILIAGGATIFFLAPELLPEQLSGLKPAEKEIADSGVRRLAFKGVNGSFIESNKLGQLFVIKGTVTNNYPKSRSFILVKGSVLDDKGAVSKRKMAYAGNTFEENQLKDMTQEEINLGLKNRLGQKGRNGNIQPGASIPFMIILENLPENLSEFTVEAVSSLPGK